MIAKGADKLKAYVGSTGVDKMYLGDVLVYSSAPPVPLPYDAEVEYLQSNGTPYIDSGIECTGDLTVEFKGMHFDTTNMATLGAIKSLSSGYFRHHYNPQLNSNYWIQAGTSSTAAVRIAVTSNAWHVISIDPVNGVAKVNNTTATFTPLSSSLTTGCNYGIFARLGLFQSKEFSLAYLKLSRGGVLLRDFIPVRKDGVGYLYDKVSGELFGNAATSGAFTYGADIV